MLYTVLFQVSVYTKYGNKMNYKIGTSRPCKIALPYLDPCLVLCGRQAWHPSQRMQHLMLGQRSFTVAVLTLQELDVGYRGRHPTQQPPHGGGSIVDGATLEVVEGHGILGRFDVAITPCPHEFDDGRVELVVVEVGIVKNLTGLWWEQW